MNKFLSITTLALLSVTGAAKAQIITTPVAAEFTFGNATVAKPDNVSSFSARDVPYSNMYGHADLYLAAWGSTIQGDRSEVTYQFMDPGTTNVVQQGSLMYDDAADVTVNVLRDAVGDPTRILVAYYRHGVGHMLDVYKIIVTSTSTSVVYDYTNQLSTASSYGRIEMDGLYHNGKIAIIWSNPGAGLEAIVGDHNNNWSNVISINGTSGEEGPDIAMRMDNSVGGEIHFISYNPSGDITKYTTNWNTVYAASTAITPSVEDINPTGIGTYYSMTIDCPEAASAPNWAYAYTDRHHVFVRYIDHFTAGTVNTAEITNGATFGNYAMNAHETFSPTIHYGFIDQYGANPTDEITVGWYTTDLNTLNGYIGVQMKADGSGLTNAIDYMGLPNGFTASSYSNINVPGIALSKSDLEAVPDYLYGAYYDYDQNTGEFHLHHAFHPWGNNVFKSERKLNLADHTYPNPFKNELYTSVTTGANGIASLQLLDITGRIVSQKRYSVSSGHNALSIDGLENILAGTYFLNTIVDGKKINTQIVVKH